MTLQSKVTELFDEEFADYGGEYSTNIDAPRSMLKSFLLTTLVPLIQEEERARIDKEITEQFKYAAEHDNYDMRGVDWTKIIHPNTKE